MKIKYLKLTVDGKTSYHSTENMKQDMSFCISIEYSKGNVVYLTKEEYDKQR